MFLFHVSSLSWWSFVLNGSVAVLSGMKLVLRGLFKALGNAPPAVALLCMLLVMFTGKHITMTGVSSDDRDTKDIWQLYPFQMVLLFCFVITYWSFISERYHFI